MAELALIDYDLICKVAKQRARKLPYGVADWRDLAQEAALRGLMGRKSVDGPMQDLLRKQLVGSEVRSGKSATILVDLDTISYNLTTSSAAADTVLIADETIKQLVYDPKLTSREQRLLKAIIKGNATLEELAYRRKVSPGRISQLLASAKHKAAEPDSTARSLYQAGAVNHHNLCPDRLNSPFYLEGAQGIRDR